MSKEEQAEIVANELSKILFDVPLSDILGDEPDSERLVILREVLSAKKFGDLSPGARKLYMERTGQPFTRGSLVPKYTGVCHAKISDDGTQCRGRLKPVHVSKKKFRTTKCLKCGKVWLVKGDNDE